MRFYFGDTVATDDGLTSCGIQLNGFISIFGI